MIVVSGEALMDVFTAGDTPAGLSLDARIGGSPLNVAIGLARLGQPVAFLGAVSTGAMGQRLARALHDERVDTSCVCRVNAPTTVSLVELDSTGVPHYTFMGHGAADRLLPMESLDGVPSATAFHFGSYAMVVEPVAHVQRALVEREQGRAVIAYDPNVRLNVEPDIARWRQTLEWMLPRTDILKISEEDLHSLLPGTVVRDVAARWLQQGVSLVVVTRGAQGASAWSRLGHLETAPVWVDVADTVGAGDTFQAALLTALAEHDLLRPEVLRMPDQAVLANCLQFAAQAAGITCARRGADMPRRAELPSHRTHRD